MARLKRMRGAMRDPAPEAAWSSVHETFIKIVAGWPRNFTAQRGRDLGFKAETSFEEIIRVHIADELGGKIA